MHRLGWAGIGVAIVAAACAAPPAPAGGGAAGTVSVWRCGDQTARIVAGAPPRLALAGESFELREVPAASGARYEAVADATTGVWNKGDRATVTLRGQALPECSPLVGAPLVALGHEPGWRLDLGDGRLRLAIDHGSRRYDAALPPAQPLADGWRHVADTPAGRVEVDVHDRLCADVATGMPHPLTVRVFAEGRHFDGCGGDPASLLVGAEWGVVEISGAAPVAASRASLRFGSDGRVAGRASCNAFTAAWRLDGEGLRIGAAAATKMACAPPLMAQEGRFFALLAAVERFEIAADGALVLHARGGGRLVARR